MNMQFDLLELPTDVLLIIVDHLKGPEALSLSLTCKRLHSLCFSSSLGKMTTRHMAKFLTALERDAGFGRNVYYCHACNRLHGIDESWRESCLTSGAIAPDCDVKAGGGLNKESARQANDLVKPIKLSFSHLRLVMNQHLYGAGRGLPLSTLDYEAERRSGRATVQCAQQARIHDNELLLLRSFDLVVSDDEAMAWRQNSCSEGLGLCEHVALFSSRCGHRDAIPEFEQPLDKQAAFKPCRDSTGACGLCLMDYDVTIVRKASSWAISIKTYNQLGGGRDPSDWKWARFAEHSRPNLFFPNRPNRRGSNNHAGTVRHVWNKAKTTLGQSARGHGNGAATKPLLPAWLRGSKPLVTTV
ncbi:hypothetical protein CDD81_5940 [Ophiocordyceps australis]|uniref:F-box domain-containing protein n=1 Tax=Ophiocordyceps australis TaxID=1399860 RepID=A0A2C5XM57_9HYPO|nr:hypothetical protein CDD81_5940 [Ophiocordyceps australis]